TIQLACAAQLQASTDGGASFSATPKLVLTNTAARTVMVRALDDALAEETPHWRPITHAVSASADLAQYPLSTLIPTLNVGVLDNDLVLLSELKVNPPGTNDAPNEFIELTGSPGLSLSNVYLLALEGNAGSDPGTVTYALNLTGARLGNNGVLMVVATNHPYSIPTGTSILTDASLSQPGGALGNGSISFLLVSSPVELKRGDDLDKGNDGVLESLPPGSTLLDAVGWSDGDKNDLVYGGVVLVPSNGTPDAATRFPGNTAANTASAWFCGNLVGPNGDSLVYELNGASANFPAGTLLTPGLANRIAPAISPVAPISGVIGDPTNPEVEFTVSDAETPAAALIVIASSSNPAVVPDTNLLVTAGAGGARTLSLNPIGVGYADILLLASDGSMTGRVTFPYAASAPGRPGSVWHLGASDGSTAIPVEPDLMLIGDDENQIIRLYPRQNSSLPLHPYDMTAFLALPDSQLGLPREVDVEASTRTGNRLFWMGSHGHSAVGESRTNRTRVFATDLSGSGAAASLAYVGRYDYLKVDLINWDTQNRHGKGTNYYGLEASDADGVPPKAPDGSGWAIEGLAMMPDSTNGAYVAFRAPIVPATNRTYALIVPVLNFAQLAANGGPPGSCRFGPPAELDLYGRGIRSL
ncbi:MAG TPA: hypothetical protein VNZ22_08920, partial [Bacillota bacterium]|nr:hypothetical protein [Bacillota bacterium]